MPGGCLRLLVYGRLILVTIFFSSFGNATVKEFLKLVYICQSCCKNVYIFMDHSV